MILCIMPQNGWLSATAPLSWGIYRNIPFALLGLLMIVLFYQSAKQHNDRQLGHCDVIIVDECQFLEPEQVDQLRAIVDDYNLPVMCFGLRTDFQCHLFAGSRRLMEVADSILEIKTICDCGAKATVNARIDGEGHIVTQGQQLLLGGNDSYIAMCHKCWIRGIRERRKIKLHGNGESIDL